MKTKFILLAISGLLILSCNTKKLFRKESSDKFYPDLIPNSDNADLKNMYKVALTGKDQE